MEIKILVPENKKDDLANFIEVCKQHGFNVTREGGGRMPNFNGYYAELKGVRWQKADTGARQLTIPDVSGSDSCWVCQKCGELVDGRNVTFEEYHEGCGGKCV